MAEPLYCSLPAVQIAQEAALRGILRDRQRFAGLLGAAETLAAEKGLILGGDAGVGRLLGRPLGAADYVFVLYSDNPRGDARAVARALYEAAPEGVGRYARMGTILGVGIVVSAEDRPLVKLEGLPTHRGRRIAGLIDNLKAPAAFAPEGTEIRVLPPEVQLISVYTGLCAPSRARDWGGLLETAEALRALFLAEGGRKPFARVSCADQACSENRYGRTGGNGAPAEEDNNGEVEGGAPPLERLRSALEAEYYPGDGRVVLPPPRGAVGRDPRARLVTSHHLDAERAAIVRVAERLGVAVECATHTVTVPGEPDLRRLTVHYRPPGGRRVPFLDIYDAGDSSLVPFVWAPQRGGGRRGARRGQPATPPPESSGSSPTGEDPSLGEKARPEGQRVGTYFLRLRFGLIELWTVRLLIRAGELNADAGGRILSERLADYRATAAEYLEARDGGGAAFAQIFPIASDGYVGKHVDPTAAAKRAQLKGPRHHSWFPCRQEGAEHPEGRDG